MNKSISAIALTVLSASLVGCATPGGYSAYGYGNGFSRHSDALTGAALGGAGGALLGGAITRDGGGALVGGALGAAVGGIVGNSMDTRRESQRYQGAYNGDGYQGDYRYPVRSYRY